MSSDRIKAAVTGAVAYLEAHPAEARYRDGPATARLRDGLVVDVSGPDGESATTDMTTGIGGTGAAPSPGWLLRAALASCAATLIALRAATVDVAITLLEVTVDSESDDRGVLGIEPDVPSGPLGVRVVVRLEASGTEPGTLRSIVDWGIDHCPTIDAVRRPIPTELQVSTGAGT